MYRSKRGQSVLTGFIQKNGNIVWIGKSKKKVHRPIVTVEDRFFFLKEMKQYDRLKKISVFW